MDMCFEFFGVQKEVVKLQQDVGIGHLMEDSYYGGSNDEG
jgi:hypothetical protein